MSFFPLQYTNIFPYLRVKSLQLGFRSCYFGQHNKLLGFLCFILFCSCPEFIMLYQNNFTYKFMLLSKTKMHGSLGSGQLHLQESGTHSHNCFIYLQTKHEMQCSCSFCPFSQCVYVCASAVSAKRKPFYQAAIYQAANQPDNLQLCLLPGWATLPSSPTASVKPQPSALLSYL